MTAQHDGTLRVPIIDIEPFRSGSAEQRRAVAAAIDRAAREVGFMQIVGHGIPTSVSAGLGAAIDGFFAQPAAAKERYVAPPDVNRGYSGPKRERLSYSLGVTSAADLFEAFNVGIPASAYPELALPAEDYPANIWPADPPEFEANVSAWMAAARALSHTMTDIFACALDLPAGYFEAFTDHSIDVLRMNHYRLPAAPDGRPVRLEPGQMGMGAHTDYGIVTILWADDVRPGLQILDANGSWHDVGPVPGALLINLGDLLARWTNDRWISTMHRVLAPIDETGRPVRRRSAAFFHDGNADATIACLPGCADDAQPARYEPVTVAGHLAAKLAGSRGGTLNPGAQREAARLRAPGDSGRSERS